MKRCAKCDILKDESEFHADQKSTDGIASWCKACKRIARREHYRRLPITGTLWDRNHPYRFKKRLEKYRERYSKAVSARREQLWLANSIMLEKCFNSDIEMKPFVDLLLESRKIVLERGLVSQEYLQSLLDSPSSLMEEYLSSVRSLLNAPPKTDSTNSDH